MVGLRDVLPDHAGVQIAYGWFALRASTPRVLLFGIAVNLAIIAVYISTRTAGTPVGPGAGKVEDIGLVDVISKMDETALIAVLAVMYLLRTRTPKDLLEFTRMGGESRAHQSDGRAGPRAA